MYYHHNHRTVFRKLISCVHTIDVIPKISKSIVNTCPHHANIWSYSQVEFFIPDWVEVLWHCLGAFLRFADLHCDVWVAGSRLILAN